MRQRRRHAKLLFFCVSSAWREPLWDGRKTSASLAVTSKIWRACGGRMLRRGWAERARGTKSVRVKERGYPGPWRTLWLLRSLHSPLPPDARALGRNGTFEESLELEEGVEVRWCTA